MAAFTTADEEHNLAVQVLCAWRLETQPVLGVKYCYMLKSRSDPSMHMAFTRGLKKNTRCLQHDGNAEAIGILAELLERNRGFQNVRTVQSCLLLQCFVSEKTLEDAQEDLP